VSRPPVALLDDALDHLRVLRTHTEAVAMDRQIVIDAVGLRLAAAMRSAISA